MFLRAILRPLVNCKYRMSSHSSKWSLIDLNFQHKIESNFWGCRRQVRRRMFHRVIPKRKALKRICRLTCLIHFKRREPSASCASTTSSRTIRTSSCFRNSNRREFQYNFLTESFNNFLTLRFTGRIYGRHITGLCKSKQEKVEKEITKAQACVLMGYFHKDVTYLKDPKLFDPERPMRPHKY